jgi:hypothetical protein
MGVERNHNSETISLLEENWTHKKKTKYGKSKPIKNYIS